MKRLFLFLFCTLFIGSCQNTEKKDVKIKDYGLFRDLVYQRLSKKEYKLTSDQLCFVKPRLDSMKLWNKIRYFEYDKYNITSTYLGYCNLSLSLVTIKDRKFLFTSQLDKSLMISSNENYGKEILTKVENITELTDFKEFKEMLSYIGRLNKEYFLSKDELTTLFIRCFVSNLPWSISGAWDKPKPLETEDDLENWKNEHLREKKEHVELYFDEKKVYLPYFKWGLLILSLNGTIKIELLKKVYPNDEIYTNSYDVGIPTCDELAGKVSQQ